MENAVGVSKLLGCNVINDALFMRCRQCEGSFSFVAIVGFLKLLTSNTFFYLPFLVELIGFRFLNVIKVTKPR